LLCFVFAFAFTFLFAAKPYGHPGRSCLRSLFDIDAVEVVAAKRAEFEVDHFLAHRLELHRVGNGEPRCQRRASHDLRHFSAWPSAPKHQGDRQHKLVDLGPAGVAARKSLGVPALPLIAYASLGISTAILMLRHWAFWAWVAAAFAPWA
jgi:hypothetical protein